MSESVLSLGQQSGIGIDCEGDTFRAAYVRRHRSRARVADCLEIPGFRELGAAECGRRYREFLRKHRLRAPQTVVALPREAVLLRTLGFPGMVEKELGRAIEYQLDSLHPFEDGAVYWDYAVWKQPEQGGWAKWTANPEEPSGGRVETLVGIAAREGVDAQAAWFEEAGIPVSQFGVKAALWIAMFWGRLQTAYPGAPALFLVHAEEGRAELVGYAPGREPIWQDLTAEAAQDESEAEAVREELKRELEQARAALRMAPEARLPLIVCGSREAAGWLAEADLGFEIVPADRLLDAGANGAEDMGAEVAAGLSAAGMGMRLPLNLLPAEKRTYEPAQTYLTTYALAAVVALLALALGVRGPVQDWLYAQHLEREMETLRPQLQEIEEAQGDAEQAQARLSLLNEARQSGRLQLAILNELTEILPPDVWLEQFSFDGQTVNIAGLAPAAAGLLQTLAASAYFENPEFPSSISQTPEGLEKFTIRARVRAGAAEGIRQ